MLELVRVICERDGLTRAQVEADIAECREEMLEALASGDIFEAEEIFANWFGLEPDYIFDII